MAVYFQMFCTSILCLLTLTMGIMFTWPSSTLLIFSSANTTLHRTMTEGEVSLLGSLSSVGALIGSPLAGIFLDRIGRKPCSIIGASCATISWVLIATCNRVEVVLFAVFISGLSSSAFLTNTAYITEICQDSIRGSMIAGIMVFYSVGMLVSYVLGGCLNYNNMVYVNLTMSIVAVLMLFILKETPLYLMRKGLEKEARISLAFYRSVKPDSKEVLNEIEVIRRALNAEVDGAEVTSPEEEKLNNEDTKKEKLSTWQFLRKSKATHRALFITITLMTMAIFQGLPVLMVYAEPLFTIAVPSMSPNLCSIIFAIINVIFGFVAAYLSDVAGRRPLLNYGSLGTGISCLVLGSQIHMNWGPSWITALSIYMFSILYIIGAGTIPFILTGEVFMPEVKNIVMMVVIEWAWLCNFLILLIFNPLVSAIGLGPVFYIFAAIGIISAMFGHYYLPETKGLTMDAIQPLFTPKRKRQIA